MARERVKQVEYLKENGIPVIGMGRKREGRRGHLRGNRKKKSLSRLRKTREIEETMRPIQQSMCIMADTKRGNFWMRPARGANSTG
jgi:hypothetical protein